MNILSKVVLLGASACCTMVWAVDKCKVGADFGAISIENRDGKVTAVFDGESEKSVDIPKSCEVDAVVLNRKFPKTWGIPATMMFPFSIDNIGALNGQIYEITDISITEKNGSSNYVVTARENKAQRIVANRPYYVNQTYDENLTIASWYGSITLVPQKEGNAGFFNITDENGNETDWVFRGTFNYKKWAKDDPELGRIYGFVARDTSYSNADSSVTKKFTRGQFVKVAAGADILPLRAYLVYESNSAQGVRANASSSVAVSSETKKLPSTISVRFVDADGNVMGISKMNARTGEFIENRWFDAKGRKMEQKPTVKGAYYNKGNKVLVK